MSDSHCTQSTVHVRFMLDADCSPGLLPRLLQPFAKRDLTPDRMWSHRNGEIMHVAVQGSTVRADERRQGEQTG